MRDDFFTISGWDRRPFRISDVRVVRPDCVSTSAATGAVASHADVRPGEIANIPVMHKASQISRFAKRRNQRCVNGYRPTKPAKYSLKTMELPSMACELGTRETGLQSLNDPRCPLGNGTKSNPATPARRIARGM